MTRRFDVAPAPHVAATSSVRGLMAKVLLALLPGLALQAWWFGPGVLLQALLAIGFALGFEAATLRLRDRPLQPAISDLSAPVTALLFALCIPPLTPWWIAAVAMAAAIVVAKQLYGGLGFNPFNPAMVGYAVVLVCWPLALSRWPAPLSPEHALGWRDSAYTIFTGALPPALQWDAIAQATPLDALRALRGQGWTLTEMLADPRVAGAGARGWTWIALAHAVGGLWLLQQRVIHWQVPVATLGTVVLATLLPWLVDADLYASPLQHLLSGSLVLAAFFIATDPVTGCTTPRGRLVFGAGVALLTLAIRRWGATPDGIAFAVLLMNFAAPWIDLHTRPRIYGEVRR